MSLFKRPNDVWLRIWLIIAWAVMVAIEWIWVQPWFLVIFTGDPVMLFVMPFLFTLAVGIVLLMMWEWLKRPDCKCWDDIQTIDKAEDNTRTPDVNTVITTEPLIAHDCPEKTEQAMATKLAGKRRPAVRKKRGGTNG